MKLAGSTRTVFAKCFLQLALILLIPAIVAGTTLGRCYHRSENGIEIRYQGGYPRSKLIHLEVAGALPDSFRLIADTQDGNCGIAPLYAADEKQVFFRNKPISGADPTSFAVLGSSYGRDLSSLYYQDWLIAGVNPAGFRLVPNPYDTTSYGVTTSAVLYRGKPIIAPAEPATFQALGGLWIRDAKNVYLQNRPEAVPGAEVSSFTVLAPLKERRRNLAYAKDRHRVYHLSQQGVVIIEGAEPASFERFNSNYCRDRSRVFYKGHPVNGAHAPSFRIPSAALAHTGEDKYGKIHLGRRVK